jgi:hypothetical protein
MTDMFRAASVICTSLLIIWVNSALAHCPIDRQKLATLNSKLRGSLAEQAAVLAPIQTLVSLYGRDCIEPLVGALMKARAEGLRQVPQTLRIQWTQILKDADLLTPQGQIKINEDLMAVDGVLANFSSSSLEVNDNISNSLHYESATWLRKYVDELYAKGGAAVFPTEDDPTDPNNTNELNEIDKIRSAFYQDIYYPNNDDMFIAYGHIIDHSTNTDELISTLKARFISPISGRPAFNILEILGNAGWKGVFAVLDLGAKTRADTNWDILFGVAQKFWPPSMDASMQKILEERYIDAAINQITAPYCVGGNVPRMLGHFLGKRAGRAIPALQHLASLPPFTYGYKDCGQDGARQALALIQ